MSKKYSGSAFVWIAAYFRLLKLLRKFYLRSDEASRDWLTHHFQVFSLAIAAIDRYPIML